MGTLKQGDIVMKKTFFGKKIGVVNRVSDDGEYFFFHKDYLWSGMDYVFDNCKVLKTEGWKKIMDYKRSL
jgi:hypothetical protein